jgi:hypothetical protein
MDFKIEIAGIEQLTAAFAKAPAIVTPILSAAILASKAYLAKNTTGAVPRRTGTLEKSFVWESQGLTATWGPRASYARFVEFGTAPHRIWPNEKKALWWPGMPWPVAYVNHPGSKANPYMERIISLSQDEINGEFGRALERIIMSL